MLQYKHWLHLIRVPCVGLMGIYEVKGYPTHSRYHKSDPAAAACHCGNTALNIEQIEHIKRERHVVYFQKKSSMAAEAYGRRGFLDLSDQPTGNSGSSIE